ncbi:NACHT, LRR and PYD domains-containing protein 12-like [Cololabis saira]|uniref:NACHT, LRR and PYD domains-containing protein 12-like n=1 Tax=Cololabis saira TaxID=129043 RepID=UPI002AD3CBB3|nr:NACHT, LRR and PYD domains-containing protein 12-like [Cololabis saira]
MENNFSYNQSVVPTTAEGQAQSRGTSFSAQGGSVISASHFNDVHVQGNLVTNINVHPPARTDGSDAVSDKSKENVKRSQDELKSYLLYKTKSLPEGTEGEPVTSLNKIYTELYIIEGGSCEVNSEHEVIDLECTRGTSVERKIHLHEIFKASSNEEDPPQRVLTKGIAGIGKTVGVQKFTRDWADGASNQAFQFVFPFTFRELNLLRDEDWSLLDLIKYFFDDEEDSNMPDYNNYNVLFIFDGLDESQFPLKFGENGLCRKITKKTKIDALLTNLIEGKLLHKASVWITSRPAAANKIPLKHINRVTEVRGFDDEQKKEYFLKTISDETIACKILDHLQSRALRSLHIMCHIPLFCWISGRVLQSLFGSCDESELPKTLTEMYTHFLIIQTQRKQQKDYQEGNANTDVIMKLGKLAFEQLQKGNIIFLEKDLKDCQIDLKQAVIYSGVCTQIIRKEHGLYKQEFYSFIHLSVQEFLAALYVQETFMDGGGNPLSRIRVQSQEGGSPVIFLHMNAVNKALDAKDGRWDLFLRFLLGLSQKKIQELLQKVLGLKERCLQSSQETINYIHEMIRKVSYADKSINLFHCLNELGDQSLVEQVQNYQSSGDVTKMSPSHWSALAFVLLVSNEDLSIFDLKKYHGSDQVLERLLRVLKASRKALLSDCKLTDRCCKCIASVLGSSSGLEELDLSGNPLYDSGMKILSDGLRSPNCKLQTLSLRQCGITEEGCRSLAGDLALNRSHLKELDLSHNKLDNEGLIMLSNVLDKCHLETLRLTECGATEEGCRELVSALHLNPSQLKILDLSRNSVGSEGVALLSSFLRNPDCQLHQLGLEGCRFTESGCAALASSLKSNPVHLRVLNLGRNDLRDSGAENLAKFLEDSLCQLEILKLLKTKLQRHDAEVLVSALVSNPSHLKELDLGLNDIGDEGVKGISALLKNPNCKMEALRLEGCRFTESGCAALASSLKSNPAHLRVLNLGRNDLRDSGAENLAKFLEDSLCQLEILNLRCCTLTEVGCQTVVAALSNSSALKELDLSFNQLKEEELKLLSGWLKKPFCKLEILSLSGCGLTTVFQTLAAALSSSSALKELDLRDNPLKDQELRLFSDWQQKTCRLERLRLPDSLDSSEKSLAPVQRSESSFLGEPDPDKSRPAGRGWKLPSDFQQKMSNELMLQHQNSVLPEQL